MFMWFYNKYQPAWLLSVIMITSEIFIVCERWMFLSVVDFIHGNEQGQHDFSDDCPPRPAYHALKFPKESTLFYWSEDQTAVVINLFGVYSPIFSTFFAGIYSDKYGGRNAVLLGLVLSGSVSSVSYLVVLRNDYVFIAMLVLRRIGEGMITAAVWSLAGKWSRAHERTMFVSILFIGQYLGLFIGELLSRTPITWRTACHISGVIYFINAFWFWLIFRCEYVPKTCKVTLIPWHDIIMSVSLYILTALIISCTIIGYVAQEQILVMYVNEILYLDFDTKWVVDFTMFLTKTVALLLCGAASDYIILKGFLSPFALRRTIPVVLLPFFYFALFVVRRARCDIDVVLACCVVLNFICVTFQSTVYTATLDVAYSFSGVIFGIIIWFSNFINHKIMYLVAYFADIHVSIKSYNKVFLLSTVIATGFSLPFILFGVRKIPWGDVVPEGNDRNGELQTAVLKETVPTFKDSSDPSDGPQNEEVHKNV